MKAFERQQGESDRAFQAYKTFRDLGPGRTLAAAADLYYGRYPSGTKQAPGQIKKWSSQFDWPDRARQRDDYVDMVRLSALEDHERSVVSEEARVQHEIRMELLRGGLKAAKRQNEMLDSPMYTERVERDQDGVIVAEIKEPARWTFDTAKKMYEIGALAAGEPTSREDVTGRIEEDGPEQPKTREVLDAEDALLEAQERARTQS
ncbi:MAG: hypothetical protein WKF67_13570 [Rubrobacteraceae bacterium]